MGLIGLVLSILGIYTGWVLMVTLVAWGIDQYMELERMFREHTESAEG